MLLDSNYEPLYEDSTSTCNNNHKLFGKPGFDVPRCKKVCTDDVQCKFFFIATTGWCLTYSACDDLRISRASGSTFKKKTGNIHYLELK